MALREKRRLRHKMDKLSRFWYELEFEKAYMKRSGNSFQDLFCEIMERGYPNDFQRVRPWGKYGDKKNDGYLKSKRMLFQIYAPNYISQEKTLAKIEEDFNGALPYWQDYFDQWIFTHNSRQGLSPVVLKKLLELEKSNPGLKCPSWGYVEISNELFALNDTDIELILGPAPSIADLLETGYPELRTVLGAISEIEPLSNQDLSPVSDKKLSSNALSLHVRALIDFGRIKSSQVGNFFQEYHDPEYGDKIAKAFNDKYTELRNQGIPPDEIFMKLQDFAGGKVRQNTRIETAILAVLTYFFEKCDIFERPRPEANNDSTD